MDRNDKDDLAILMGAAALAVAAVGSARSRSIVSQSQGGSTVAGSISSGTATLNAPYIETIDAATSRDLPSFTGNLAQVEIQWAFGAARYYLFDDGATQVIRTMQTSVFAADFTVTLSATRTPRINNVSASAYQVMITYVQST